MTDYHPLIARAVEGLDKNTGEARRALYERARRALVTQLRGAQPALSESEITKERLALEEAIRKVEAEAARKLRTAPRADAPAETGKQRPPAPQMGRAGREIGLQLPAAPAWPPLDHSGPLAGDTPYGRSGEPQTEGSSSPKPDSPEADTRRTPVRTRARLLGRRMRTTGEETTKDSREAENELRDLGAATTKAVRPARGPYRRSAQSVALAEDSTASPARGDVGPPFSADGLSAATHDLRQLRGLEPNDETDEQLPPTSHLAQLRPSPAEKEPRAHRLPGSYLGLVRLSVVLVALAALAAIVAWEWSSVAAWFAQSGSKQPAAQAAHETPSPQQKFSGRVPQEQGSGQASGTVTAGSQTAPAAAQRVVLYEEDPNNPQGRRYVGSVIWRTETVSPGAGLAPELAVRADVEIPDRGMTVTWSLRRNTDKALPASHTIDIMFKLPTDFAGGGIANVPGILMKQAEQARGTPLAGLAVKVTNGFFLIGLSAVETDVQRNIALLKDRQWFDIPVVYSSGGRAILAMEKGPPGDRAFAEAFAAWAKK